MAILFEWYENPVAPNQPQEETKLHARITLNGKTGTDRLLSLIHISEPTRH